MSSKINTGTMNMNYPLPGVNNSTQGFRDNFSSIKLNLDAAKAEIDEIQSKALLKSPLTGTSLNNDVNNNIIRNAQTLGFRSSTYNLGSNLSGTVSVDLTYGDVQYGGIDPTSTGISLQFLKWAPTETYSSVQLILTVTPGQKINLPITSTTGVRYGTSTIEGFDSVTNNITVPYGVDRLHYQFNTVDCGETIEIVSLDRSRRTSSLINRTPLPIGGPGDLEGAITYGSGQMWVCSKDYDGANIIWSGATTANFANFAGSANYANVANYANFSGTANTANSVDGANVIGAIAFATNANFADFAGNVTIASQPNITSVGTLTSLTVSGISTLGPVTDVSIGGGAAGQVLSTNGSGALSWVTVSTGSLSNGTSNVTVTSSGNVNTSVAGNANVFVVTGTGANVTGTLNATGNANVGNIGAAGGIFTYVTGNGANLTGITAANVTSVAAGNLVALNVQAAINELDSEKLAITGGTITGDLTINGNIMISGRQVSSMTTGLTTVVDINCALDNYFMITVGSAQTFSAINVPAAGSVYNMTLELLTDAGASITWPASVRWPNATAPTLSTSGKTTLIMMVTNNGGAIWRAASLIDYAT